MTCCICTFTTTHTFTQKNKMDQKKKIKLRIQLRGGKPTFKRPSNIRIITARGPFRMPEIVVPTDEQAYAQPRWTDVQKQMPKDTNNEYYGNGYYQIRYGGKYTRGYKDWMVGNIAQATNENDAKYEKMVKGKKKDKENKLVDMVIIE
eukprot:556232_1